MVAVQLNGSVVLWRARVSIPSEKIPGFCGEREKGAALYNILRVCGRFSVPFPMFNLFNQSLKKGGCFNTTNRAPYRTIAARFTPIVVYMSFQ